jgi:hypothetical protein
MDKKVKTAVLGGIGGGALGFALIRAFDYIDSTFVNYTVVIGFFAFVVVYAVLQKRKK